MAAGTYPLYCWYVDIDETNDLLFMQFQHIGGMRPIGIRLKHGRFWARGTTNQQDDLFGNLQQAIRDIEDRVAANQWARTVVRWKGDNYSSAPGKRGRSGQMQIIAQSWVTILGNDPRNTFDAQEFGWSVIDPPQNANPDLIVAQDAIPWDGSGVPGVADRRHGFISTGPYDVKRCWVPEREFVYDSENYPSGRSASGVCMDGTTTRTVQWGTRTRRDIRHDVLDPAVIFQAEEDRLFQSLQRFHAWYSAGREFEFHPDMSEFTQLARGSLWGRYVMGEDSRDPWPAETVNATARLYNVALSMLRVRELQAPVAGPGEWSSEVEGIAEPGGAAVP